MKAKGEKKIFLSLRLTAEESKLCQKLAERDHRSQQGEIVWLLESYFNGELMDRREILIMMERMVKQHPDNFPLNIGRVSGTSVERLPPLPELGGQDKYHPGSKNSVDYSPSPRRSNE